MILPRGTEFKGEEEYWGVFRTGTIETRTRFFRARLLKLVEVKGGQKTKKGPGNYIGPQGHVPLTSTVDKLAINRTKRRGKE